MISVKHTLNFSFTKIISSKAHFKVIKSILNFFFFLFLIWMVYVPRELPGQKKISEIQSGSNLGFECLDDFQMENRFLACDDTMNTSAFGVLKGYALYEYLIQAFIKPEWLAPSTKTNFWYNLLLYDTQVTYFHWDFKYFHSTNNTAAKSWNQDSDNQCPNNSHSHY